MMSVTPSLTQLQPLIGQTPVSSQGIVPPLLQFPQVALPGIASLPAQAGMVPQLPIAQVLPILQAALPTLISAWRAQGMGGMQPGIVGQQPLLAQPQLLAQLSVLAQQPLLAQLGLLGWLIHLGMITQLAQCSQFPQGIGIQQPLASLVPPLRALL